MYTWYGHPLYRYKDDTTGRFVGSDTVAEWADISRNSAVEAAKALASPLANQSLSLGDWQQEMRDLIKAEAIRQYKVGFGAGDFEAVDYGSIGGMLTEQYRYLDNFAQQIANGELSEAQIANRAGMYLKSTREALERAKARTRGIPTLPAYPGDGRSCLGLVNCGCEWEHHFRNGKWESYWRLGATEHCALCLDHASEWSPYES